MMTMQRSESQYTRSRIMESFWELYETTDIKKITVRQIAERSGIYRTTFYRHFSDVYAILEQIEAMLYQELQSIVLQEDMGENLRVLSRMLSRNHSYLRVLLNGDKAPSFAAAYKKELVTWICRLNGIEMEHMDEGTRYVVQKTMLSVVDLIFLWLDSGCLSLGEVAYLAEGYMYKGIVPTMKDKWDAVL